MLEFNGLTAALFNAVSAMCAACVAQPNAQTTRTWYFPDGHTAAVLTFDQNGFRTKSEVHGPNGRKGYTSVYSATNGGGGNCLFGSAKYSSGIYSCLIYDLTHYGTNLVVFGGGPEESWGKHGVKRHAIFNGQKWTWYISGFNNDNSKPNLTIEEVVITDLSGKLIGNYVPAPDGNFMDNMFSTRPVAERPRYYITTAAVNLNAAHFVPVVGNKVIAPGTMPTPSN